MPTWCAVVAKEYSGLQDGVYTNRDGSCVIEKRKIYSFGEIVNSPIRVNISTKILEIQDDLNLRWSTLYYLLVWGFLKLNDVHQLDKFVDQKCLEFCKQMLEWSFDDFVGDILPILRQTPNEETFDRIEYITFHGNNIKNG